jgi:hypothetical protein
MNLTEAGESGTNEKCSECNAPFEAKEFYYSCRICESKGMTFHQCKKCYESKKGVLYMEDAPSIGVWKNHGPKRGTFMDGEHRAAFDPPKAAGSSRISRTKMMHDDSGRAPDHQISCQPQ